VIYTIGTTHDPKAGVFWAILRTETNSSHEVRKVEVVYQHRRKANVEAKFDLEYAPTVGECDGCSRNAGVCDRWELAKDDGCKNWQREAVDG
jgi:hypothetical protein